MRRRPGRALWPLLAALALAPTLAPRVASADTPLSAADRRRARALYDEAEKFVDAERWADALGKLEALAALGKATETPVVVFYIGLCKANLGRLRESLQDYRRARELLAADARSPAKERKLLEEKLNVGVDDLDARIPRVTLRRQPGDPPTDALRVTVDGAEVEAASVVDAPLPLDPGEHRVAAEAPSRKPVERAFTLAERQALEVRLDFAPVAARPAPRAPAPPPPPPPSGGTQRALGYAALALGAAGVIAGGVHVTLDRFAGNDEKNADLVTIGAGGGGLLFAGLGIVLLATAPSSAPRARAGEPAPGPALASRAAQALRFGRAPAPGGGGWLGVGGSF